jgi:VWFA-related protein
MALKAAFVVAAVSLALSQSAPPRLRSGVEVVTVDALVTQGDRPLSGLKAEDFLLRDNGIVQEIDSVTVDDAPVSMLLALDTSNSVEGPALTHLKQAAMAAVDALTGADRAAILTFADTVTLRADWGGPSAATRQAIAGAAAGGATSLYDAAYAALTLSDSLPGRRSFVLLFCDGGDTSSWLPARALVERAKRSDAVVYVVTRRPPRLDARLEYRSGIELWPGASPQRDLPAMVEVTNITGGQLFIAARADVLRTTFSTIVTEFRNRYLITYRPQGVAAPGWHTIDLQLKKGKAAIKARRGYLGS